MTYEDRLERVCNSLRAHDRFASAEVRQTKAQALELILEQARLIVRLENDVMDLELGLLNGSATRLAA